MREAALRETYGVGVIEELGSDDDSGREVVAWTSSAREARRFVSDPLLFTGADMSPRNRQAYNYEETSSESYHDLSDVDDYSDGSVSPQQIALKDKEAALVQSALARMRRAKEKGRDDVKLRVDEAAALEKWEKMKAQQARQQSRAVKSKKENKPRRKKSSPPTVTVPISRTLDDPRPSSRKNSKQHRLVPDDAPPSGVPGMIIQAEDGRMVYAPVDYRPGTSSSHSSRYSPDSPTRPRSSSSRVPGPPNNYPYAYGASGAPYPGNRHVSDSGPRPGSSASQSSFRGPLPHEREWIHPSSRKNSLASGTDYEFAPGREGTPPGPPPGMPVNRDLSAAVLGMEYAERRYASGPEAVPSGLNVSYSAVPRSPPRGGGGYTGYPPPLVPAPLQSQASTGSGHSGHSARYRGGIEVEEESLSETSSEGGGATVVEVRAPPEGTHGRERSSTTSTSGGGRRKNGGGGGKKRR
jgi:hypothetical protein